MADSTDPAGNTGSSGSTSGTGGASGTPTPGPGTDRPGRPTPASASMSSSAPAAAPSSSSSSDETSAAGRWTLRAAIATGVLGVVGTLIATLPSLMDSGSGTDSTPPPADKPIAVVLPTTPTTTTPPTPIPTRKKTETCVKSPAKAHGLSAAFVSPCDGATLQAPNPIITLKVPRFPADDGSEGQIWVVARILSDGRGRPVNSKPLHPEYPVDLSTAKRLEAGTWIKDLMIYQSCHDDGPAQILVYWLSPSGVKQTAEWGRSPDPITIPKGSVLLDQVNVNMVNGC